MHTTLMDAAGAKVESQAKTVTDVRMDILDMDLMIEMDVKVRTDYYQASYTNVYSRHNSSNS